MTKIIPFTSSVLFRRKMLDKDIREVRQIQEMLFEDEEGAVRQRQFRWKNAESAGFSLDDTRNENADADANEGSGDEENEHLWRKIRYEREQLLLEKGLKGVSMKCSFYKLQQSSYMTSIPGCNCQQPCTAVTSCAQLQYS